MTDVGRSATGTEQSALTDTLAGDVLLPGDEGFDAARTVWNAMVDTSPAVIARPTDAMDVARAIRFARENEAARRA